MNRNLLIYGLIVTAAAAAGIALSMKPWEVYREQREAADVAIAKMKASEVRHEDLVRREAAARSSLGKEQIARKQGMLPANEVPAPR